MKPALLIGGALMYAVPTLGIPSTGLVLVSAVCLANLVEFVVNRIEGKQEEEARPKGPTMGSILRAEADRRNETRRREKAEAEAERRIEEHFARSEPEPTRPDPYDTERL